MNIDQLIRDAVTAAVEPMRVELARVTTELQAVRKALPTQYVSLGEAAKLMGCSWKTASRRYKTGEWPGRKDGRSILIDLSALHPIGEEEIALQAYRLRAVSGETNAKSEKAATVGRRRSAPAAERVSDPLEREREAEGEGRHTDPRGS